MNYCKECKHYVVHRVDGPQCTKGKGRATSPISTCDDFEEPAGAGDADVQSILSGVPDKTVREEPVAEAPKPEKKRRGRKKEHENYEDENGVLMKYCRVCKQYKPAEDFYRKTGTPDGYAYECKACRTKHQRDKRAELRAGRKKEFENYVDEVTGVTMKYCRACKQYKPILAFYPNATQRTGSPANARSATTPGAVADGSRSASRIPCRPSSRKRRMSPRSRLCSTASVSMARGVWASFASCAPDPKSRRPLGYSPSARIR